MPLSPKYVGPDQGAVISPVGGDVTTFKAVGADTGGAYFLMEQLVPPGHGPRLHVHRREEEAFYVVSGEFAFELGDQTIVASQGSFVLGPRNIPHRFWNSGTIPGRLLVLGSPAGLENFFVEYSKLLADQPRDLAQHAALALEYGLEFVDAPGKQISRPQINKDIQI